MKSSSLKWTNASVLLWRTERELRFAFIFCIYYILFTLWISNSEFCFCFCFSHSDKFTSNRNTAIPEMALHGNTFLVQSRLIFLFFTQYFKNYSLKWNFFTQQEKFFSYSLSESARKDIIVEYFCINFCSVSVTKCFHAIKVLWGKNQWKLSSELK
jgi:hypothetical protein